MQTLTRVETQIKNQQQIMYFKYFIVEIYKTVSISLSKTVKLCQMKKFLKDLNLEIEITYDQITLKPIEIKLDVRLNKFYIFY